MNGKIYQFAKDHWLGILSVVVVCAAILYGIHSCRQSTTINVTTKGNRVRLDCQKTPK